METDEIFTISAFSEFDGEIFIHYNPDTQEYVVGAGLLGACIFNRVNAEGVLSQLTNYDCIWKINKVNQPIIKK